MTNRSKNARVGRRVRAIGCAALVGAAVLAMSAPAAQAQVIERFSYTIDPGDDPNDDNPLPTGTCGLDTPDPSDDFTINAFNTGVGKFIAKQRGKGDYVYESQSQHFTQTTSALGVTWTADIDYSFKAPLQLLSVEGDIETWRGMNTQHIVVHYPNGLVDYRLDTHAQFVVAFNTATGEDEIVSYKLVGHDVGGDSCADALRYANV